MTEIDYVVPAIVIEKNGMVDFSELYLMLKEWLEKRNYAIVEKAYNDEVSEKHKIEVKWEAQKEIDDYTRFVIKIGIKGNVEEVSLKDKKAFKGIVTVKFEAWMEQDYEDRWENSASFKFMRGLYDKYALKKRFSKYSYDLKEETYDAYYETKAYLGLLKTAEK